MSERSIKVVAAVLRNESNQIFATQRGYGNYKDWWEFPGGKIEGNETPEEALAREIREELGAEIEIEGFLEEVHYDYPEYHIDMRCYWAKVKNGDLVLKEHEASAWLGKDDLYSVKWLPADISVLERIREVL